MMSDSVSILIVDDEEQIGMLTAAFLKNLGLKTFLADGASSALEIWKEHQSEIDVLLTDLAMPAFRGDRLASQLLKEKPNLRVVFMSGNPMRADETVFQLEEGVNFLHKPFSRDALVDLFKTHILDALDLDAAR